MAALDEWGPDGWAAYMKAWQGLQPATAPLWWPLELVFAALEAWLHARVLRLERGRRGVAVMVTTIIPLGWLYGHLHERAERHRATALGLTYQRDQPRLPNRPRCGVIIWMLLFSVVRALRARRRGERVEQTWERQLARRVSRELVRRWEWRHAGGPTRPVRR